MLGIHCQQCGSVIKEDIEQNLGCLYIVSFLFIKYLLNVHVLQVPLINAERNRAKEEYRIALL